MWTRAPDIVGPMWLAIFIIWAISGLTVKETVRSKSDARARLLVWAVMLGWFILFDQNLRPGILAERFIPMGPVAAYSGLALTVVGLGFALWARIAIGRNWGGAITVQEGHKVIRNGPYAVVRHPIYAGFMLATLGTAIVFGQVAGLISTALVVLAWGYKGRLEEHFLIEQLGPEYEQYRHEVKALIPGVW